ncbi:MAG: ABC transporter permease [Actinomycetota bacterium]|nr:ABC transporter permease [Actinomycetota bacterium]
MSVHSGLGELVASRELLSNLTLRELRGKYKRTALGWGWSLVNPLAMMAIYSLVFGILLRVPTPPGAGGLRNYPLFLLCALLPWTYLSNAMTGGMEVLVGNANLIKKTYFRREVLVVSTVLSFAVTFAIEMVVLAVAFLVFGSLVLPWLPVALAVMALLTVFATGIALMLSVLNVYFRDARHLLNIGLQLWFYATPILYPVSIVTGRASLPHWLKVAYQANPMVGFAEAMRDVLYRRQFPPLGTVGYLCLVSVAALTAGAWLFKHLEGRLAEEL